jgi:molecular chaperone Hsp33
VLETSQIEYRCYCTREHVVAALSSIGEKELEDMASEGKTVEVTCQFCDPIYNFKPEEIQALRGM